MQANAKKQAILDIKEELKRQHKCFLAFRKNLDPVMGKLVYNHIKSQQQASNSFWQVPPRANTQIVARCFFSKATEDVKLNDYSKYYEH